MGYKAFDREVHFQSIQLNPTQQIISLTLFCAIVCMGAHINGVIFLVEYDYSSDYCI